MFTPQDRNTFLTEFDFLSNSIRKFALSLCDKEYNQIFNRGKVTDNLTTDDQSIETMSCLRPFKFLQIKYKQQKKLQKKNVSKYPIVSGIPPVENFINSTKAILYQKLLKTSVTQKNLTKSEKKALASLKRLTKITVKPADKNLGAVILNSEDYMDQCLSHLTSNVYTRVTSFPEYNIKQTIQEVLIGFKDQLIPYKHLYESLQPTKEHRIPSFYGLPKIHKALCENGLPPLRPIVSHLNSLLSASASFIDHSLQPLACAFPDFLQNSTELIRELENLTIPVDAVLITLDVINLFPSIPQKECLDIIHEAMFKRTELIIFDPNLITRLLAVNMSNNFFQFSNARKKEQLWDQLVHQL